MDSERALADAIRGDGLIPAFQPIVSLDHGTTVGFEALARWPGLDGIGPEEVLSSATATGHRNTLDQRCAAAAIDAALAANLPPRTLILVNHEPGTSYPGMIDSAVLARARDEFSVVFELTERSLLTHPHTLLSTVEAIRRDGFMIALDDVGAHPDSLALLDVLAPDIIKLDMQLVQQHQPKEQQARTISAVLAYQERHNTPIIAEGVETDADAVYAVALGASLAQGFKYGRPTPIGSNSHSFAHWAPPVRTRQTFPAVPSDLIQTDSAACRVGSKDILTALSMHIEEQASCTSDPPIVLTALQHRRFFTAATRQRYADLAETCPLVAVFGERLPDDLGRGVRGASVAAGDPLCAEWTVLALGPQLTAALIAREKSGRHEPISSDDDRQFDFILTYDREVVTRAAQSLLQRML